MCIRDSTWIGARIAADNGGGTVSIPPDKLEALAKETAHFLSTPVVGRRELRSFCGKLSSVAGTTPAMRPFTAMYWAAVCAETNLPAGLVHTKTFRHALDWTNALFTGLAGQLCRHFPLATPIAHEGNYISTDACPWGMGGVLFKDFRAVAWFATPLGAPRMPGSSRRLNRL